MPRLLAQAANRADDFALAAVAAGGSSMSPAQFLAEVRAAGGNVWLSGDVVHWSGCAEDDERLIRKYLDKLHPVLRGEANPKTMADMAVWYIEKHHLAIADVPPGKKFPLHDFTKPEGYITDPEAARQDWEAKPKHGICTVLGPSGICSIDVDNPEIAEPLLAELGIDLVALRAAGPTVIGDPTHYRIEFRAPEGLEPHAHKLVWPANNGAKPITVFELRSGPVQDVLPPTRHPGTKKPYRWLTPPEDDFPLLPAALTELWTNWDSYKPDLESSCPWAKPLKPKTAARGQGARANVIGAYNQARSVEALLEVHGYKRQRGSRWMSPTSSSGLAGVKILEGRVYSHHASDPLSDGQSHDAFDVYRILDHGGDLKAAIKATATELGIANAHSAPIENITKEKLSHFLTTDLSNADRIIRHFGDDILVSAGLWHVWTGTHWQVDEPCARKKSFGLSAIILDEANGWREKAEAADSEDEKKQYQEIYESLRKWAIKSEMTWSFDAALRIVKDRITKPSDLMNKDPWLLNVANGTVDLRTGEIRPHLREDFISRVILINYDADATADRFKQFVKEIYGEAGSQHCPISEFIQRWFGYSVTGSIREQKFVTHWGDGGNGKSTLLDAVSGALGPYASASPPHLLIAGAENRHPTERAFLWGLRMVTAYESGEEGCLREEFIKQATGGDPITGRFMRQDFFSFLPTHKLQLCTNYKPAVKGTDWGIWRRVLLVPYTTKWGDEKAVASGRASLIEDNTLAQTLSEEQEGILAWVIEGAKLWFKSGLNPPHAILAAGESYMQEQDRVQQFIDEECIKEGDGWEPLSLPGTNRYGDKIRQGLYPAYEEWCRASGYHKLGKGRFQEAFRQKVVHGRWESKKIVGDSGKRREVVGFCGVRLHDGELYE